MSVTTLTTTGNINPDRYMERLMAATEALEIVSLASAKEHLDVEHNDDDALITRQIGQAVSYVSKLNGLPLVESPRQYFLLRRDSTDALLDMPFIWPKPVRSVNFVYANENERVEVDAVTANQSSFVKDLYTGMWMVNPSMFYMDIDEWPVWSKAAINVIVGVPTVSGSLEAAVYVALSNLYDGEEFSPAIGDLVNG